VKLRRLLLLCLPQSRQEATEATLALSVIKSLTTTPKPSMLLEFRGDGVEGRGKVCSDQL
jgi:hypothetical protein